MIIDAVKAHDYEQVQELTEQRKALEDDTKEESKSTVRVGEIIDLSLALH